MERLLKDAQKISGVKYDLSNLSDVYEAIHVIQGEMGISGRTAEDVAQIAKNTGRVVSEQLGTTAKEAASTFSGSLASMKSAFSDVLANLSLGRDVGPSLSALGETVFTFLEGNLIPMVGNVLSALPEVLSEVLSTAIRGLNKVANGSDGLVQTGVELVTSLTRVILSNLPYLIEAGVGIVSALGRAILSTDWGKVVSDLMEGLKNDMDLAAGEILGTDGNIVGSLIDAVVAGMPRFLDTGADVVGGLIDGIVMALPEILEAGNEVFGALIDGAMELLPDIISTGLLVVEDLVAGIEEALPTVLDVGGDLVLKLLEGLFVALPGVFEAALSLLETLVDTIITNLPQILQTGKEILLGVVSGIREALPDMLVAAADTIGTIVTGLAEHLPEILAAGFDLMISLVEGIGDALPDIIEAAGEAAQNIWDAICEIDWIQLGKDLVNGLIAGIGSMVGSLWDAAVGIGESAVGAIKDFFGIASPSKLMRDEVGRFIPAGIAVGVEANAKPLKDSLNGLADMTSGTLQAELSGRALRMAVPASQRSAGSTSIVLNVYGAQGQSVEELADIVMRKMRYEYARKEAAL